MVNQSAHTEHTLLFNCNNHIIIQFFVEMNILKSLQHLEVVTEQGSGKQRFQKCREILKDYKSKCNHMEICLKRCLKRNVACPQSVTLSKNKLRCKYFSIFCLPFRNTCFKETLKEKSSNFEMQCMCCSRCIGAESCTKVFFGSLGSIHTNL